MLELNQLYNMDCMEGMKTFPDNYFDLAIVDPPYGIGIGKKVGGDKPFGSKKFRHGVGLGVIKSTEYKAFDDSKTPNKQYFDELINVSKNQIIWGGNYFIDYLNSTSCFIIWDKVKTGFFADAELAWTSFDSANKIFKYMWNGMLQENMKNKEHRIHPTQKPTQLYKWILNKYAKPNFKIIDTHAGSCSSVIAFLDFGCDWIAFEIDKDYYKAASKRIEIHKMQLKLNYEMEQ